MTRPTPTGRPARGHLLAPPVLPWAVCAKRWPVPWYPRGRLSPVACTTWPPPATRAHARARRVASAPGPLAARGLLAVGSVPAWGRRLQLPRCAPPRV